VRRALAAALPAAVRTPRQFDTDIDIGMIGVGTTRAPDPARLRFPGGR
jgi:hypothetical protein